MIEFDPVQIQGQTLRWHWVAVYETADGIHVFADSKHPGFIAGAYATVADFIAEYAASRGREVVSYRELENYQRTKMARAERPR